jgi:hypothetical protein
MMMEVGAANDKRIDIHCTGAAGVNRAETLVWSVRAWQWGKWGEGAPYAFKTGLWPTSQHATVPGLLFRLLHELDSALHQLEEERRLARGRTLPGM